MRKILFIILLLITIPCYAGTVTLPYTWSTGDQVTATKKNNELNAITNVVNGGLNNSNADTTNGFRFYEVLGAAPAAGTQGRMIYDISTDLLKTDTGSAIKTYKTLSDGQTLTGNNTFSGTNTFSSLVATTADINAGTVDAITSLTVANNIDIGNYTLRASNILADSLSTVGRVLFTTTNGALAYDADLSFATDTLTATKIAAYSLTGKLTAGATEIEGSNFDIDGGDISAGTISGGLTWSAAQDLNSQALTNANLDSPDIDGGTLDGVQIGGTIATGELIVNNSSDDADGLGSQGTAGQFLVSAGTEANPVWSTRNVSLITTSGAGTWTAPTGVTKIYISMIGGGGGGGNGNANNGAGGGSSGAWILNYPYTVVAGNTYNLVVGAGGAASGAGTASTFDATISCTGGTAGNDANQSSGAANTAPGGYNGVDAPSATGGAAGDYLHAGGNGGAGHADGGGGGGGGSAFGAGAAGATDTGGGVGHAGATAGANTGAGGGGASANNGGGAANGGAGGSGIIIIMY